MHMGELHEICTGMFVVAFLFIWIFLNHTTRYGRKEKKAHTIWFHCNMITESLVIRWEQEQAIEAMRRRIQLLTSLVACLCMDRPVATPSHSIWCVVERAVQGVFSNCAFYHVQMKWFNFPLWDAIKGMICPGCWKGSSQRQQFCWEEFSRHVYM